MYHQSSVWNSIWSVTAPSKVKNSIPVSTDFLNLAPSVSHPLFADDSFLFFRANTIESSRALEILNLNERASGQSVNFQKSSILFSSNTRWETRRAVCGMLNVTEALDTRFFLGLPAAVGRDKRAIFGYIKTKVWNRMSGWKSRFFS